MSFLSDILKGNFSNLGGDLFGSPAAIAETLGTLGTIATLGLAGPELLGGLGAAGAGAGAGAAGAASAPLDLLAGGAAAGTATPAAIGDILPATGALASGLATDPTALSSAAIGSFAPGLDTSATALGTPLAGLAPPASTVATAAPAIGGGGSPAAPGAAGAPLGFAPTNTTLAAPGDPTNFTTIGPGAGTASTPASGFDSAGNPLTGGAAADSSGLSTIGKFLSSNKGLLTLLGLGVGGQVLSPAITKAFGLDKVPGSGQLQNLAQQENNLAAEQQQYGQALQQPLVTGVLPPGQQQSVTNALNDAIATIKSRYGALGLSGSTEEADAISNAQNQSVALQGQLEQQMAQTGASAVSAATSNLGLEDSIYNSIMQATISQDQQLGNAISKFAAAVGTGAAIKGGANLAASV